MSSKLCSLSAILALLFSISCAQPEPETAQPAPAESAPVEEVAELDPAVADPEHYSVELDNERVRILRITYGPGEESAMHSHPDSVAVFLTDAVAEMTAADGSTEELSVAAGQAMFAPARQHKGKNLGDEPWEVIEVELKPGAGTAAAADVEDPTVVDADHYTAEFENDKVRIVRIAYGAGEESVMHYHPDSVAVFLTDHLVQMTLPDGSTSEISTAAGDALFIPAGEHLPKNISDGPWELILIELK
jgi:quercetin dioxygenase-like cupin family protein